MAGHNTDEAKEAIYHRDRNGRFVLGDDRSDHWLPDRPVTRIDWHSANRYIRWLNEQSPNNWRLPRDLEREKAALLSDNRTLIERDQENQRSLTEVSATLNKEKQRSETMSIFPFFLMVSFLANIYLIVYLAKLLQRYRELVTTVRTSHNPAPAV